MRGLAVMEWGMLLRLRLRELVVIGAECALTYITLIAPVHLMPRSKPNISHPPNAT
jgi:hypothetical protein